MIERNIDLPQSAEPFVAQSRVRSRPWPGVDSREPVRETVTLRPLTAKFGVRYCVSAVLTSLPLLAADLLGLIGANLASWALLQAVLPAAVSGLPLLPACLLAMQPAYGLFLGLFPAVGMSAAEELRRLSIATTLWAIPLLMVSFLRPDTDGAGAAVVALTYVVALVVLPVARWGTRRVACRFRWWGQPAIIFGGGIDGAFAHRSLELHPERGLRPLGVIDDLHSHWADEFCDPKWYLGPPQSTSNIADDHGVFWGIVAPTERTSAEMARLLDHHATSIPHLLVLRGDGEVRSWDGARNCGELSGFRIDERLLLPVPQLIKRCLDVALTGLVGICVLPLVAAIAVAIKLTSPGPIYFHQERVGKDGRRFRTWKFRSMAQDAEARLHAYLHEHPEKRREWDRYQKLKEDPRITRVGQFLRKTSLDELPQLWNVLIGDMSLVGPRPITADQIEDYENFHLYVRLRPGITGLWQINGRNRTTFQRRTEFDTVYIRNWSAWWDLCILARTIKVVLLADGAY